ncbi:MAG: phage tail protein [Chitinophagales bacterium]
MIQPYIGEVRMFGGSFAPRGWALCNGQLLSIDQNQSLYSLLGTLYGGDGRGTFGLPDLRGRTGIHTSQEIQLGSRGGRDIGPAPHQEKAEVLGPTEAGNVTAVTNVGGSGGGRSPYAVVLYIIATEGSFPPRD